MPRRYVASIAIGAVLAVALTGCRIGREDARRATRPASALETLKHVLRNAAGADSYQLATDITSLSDSGDGVMLKGHADVRSRPSVGQRWSVSWKTPAGKPAGGIREIILGDTIYLRPSPHELPFRQPWVRLSSGQMDTLGTVIDRASGVNELSDLSATIAMLSVSSDVQEVGRETVENLTTTHYQGTFAISDARTKLGTRSNVLRFLQRNNTKVMTFDLWVDGNSFPRRVRLTHQVHPPTTLVVDTAYTAFNRPVTISAPPRSQVFDATDLDGRLSGVSA